MAPRRPCDGDDERDGPDPSNPSVYEGERDAEGRPHGRGRMRLDDEGVWHEGRFVRGARHGRGTLRFPPDEYEPGRRGGRDSESDSEGSTRRDASRIPRRVDDYDFPVGGDRLAGTFVEGVLHGPAVYHSADGSSRKGTYVHGELTGLVEEFDASGALVFRGDYSDGRRHGDGVLRQPDGSVVVSYWHEGTQGCEGIFIYPRAYGVPVDASLKDKVPTKCRGYGRDAAAAASAKLAKLANLANLADGTSAARNARPSFLFGAFAPPRAARDALAGEAAFFARHDAFGVVRAGSCWARFDEFEGSSSDASGKKNSEGFGFVSYRRDDFGIDGNDRNGDDVFLREWLRREPRAWREPFETPDHPTIPKLEARGVFSAASPEPLDRSQLELVRETRRGEAIGDFSRPAVRARARLAPNEIVGFIDPGDRRVVAPRGGCLPGSAPTSRWSPHDRIFYARELLPGEAEGAGGAAGGGADAERDDADLRSDDERGSSSPSSSSSADSDSDSDSDSVVRDATDDDGRAIPRGGVFFSLSESETRFRASAGARPRESARTPTKNAHVAPRSKSPLKQPRVLGGLARTATTGVPSTRRAPFAHPALGVAFALVASEPVPAGAAPTQPPDYACGWALHPASEAGYYHHLRVSPPATVCETPGTANLGLVRVTQHGPWRALWLDGVEQGLAYDARFQRLETGDLRPSRPFAHDPRVVGFEYVRAMATAAVASMGAKFMGAEGPPRFHSSSHGKTDPITETETETDQASAKFGRERDDATTLCVGLGAGSLPAFLANAFVGAKKNKTKTCAPGAFRVECVEIDRAVAAAAREVLGVAYVPARGGLSAEEEDRGDSDDDAANERDDSTNSTNRRAVPFALRVDDAARYLAHLGNTSEDEDKRKRFALICLDAYDGKGEIPSHLKTRAFLRDARLCLAPGGAVVANCFDAPPGSRARENLLAFCEALGGYVAGACAVRVRLLKVEGQESNVVVVAEATEREKKEPGAFGSRDALRSALAAAFAFLPAEARAALCDVDRLEISGELTSKYDTPEAGEDVDG